MVDRDEADRHRISPEQHRRIFAERIEPALFARAKPQAEPTAVVFGGQPGAGKSAAVDHAVAQFGSSGCVQIIGDDMRGYHPRYAALLVANDATAAYYTDRDTGAWVEMAIARAAELKANIVIEGTMRDADKVEATMRDLRRAGFRVDARALAVHERLSYQGILERYEEQKKDRGTGRLTTDQSHAAAYSGMVRTLARIEAAKLADSVTLYRRGAQAIYTNTLDPATADWSSPRGAVDALEAERARPMTLSEARAYRDVYETIQRRVADRQGTPAELARIGQLGREAGHLFAGALLRHADEAMALAEAPQLAAAFKILGAAQQAPGIATLPKPMKEAAIADLRQRLAAQVDRGLYPTAAQQRTVDGRTPGHER